MKKKMQVIGSILLAVCILNSKLYATDDKERNMFNQLTDWSVTFGKSSQEKKCIIDQRVQMRATDRASVSS